MLENRHISRRQSYTEGKRLASLYNIIPNMIWTVLHLTPVTVYCFSDLPLKYLYIFGGISIAFAALPHRFYFWIQLSNRIRVYHKVGILLIRKFSQDGDWVNQAVRRRYPNYTVIFRRQDIDGYIAKTYFFERFHMLLWIFMLAVSIYAAVEKDWIWAIFIFLNNILYNLYPIFLQQYNRLRVLRILSKSKKI